MSLLALILGIFGICVLVNAVLIIQHKKKQ
jgi:hypothetical protein